MANRPPKPTRLQQKQQAKILDSFIIPSRRINITEFKQSLKRTKPYSYTSTSTSSQPLQRACSLNDLIIPLAPIFKDSNLLSELRDHQHDLAIPHGSLHGLHHPTEPQPELLQLPTQPNSIPVNTHSNSATSSSTSSVSESLDPTLCKSKRVRKKAAGPPQSINHKPKPIQDLIIRLSSTGLKLLQPDFDGMWYVRSVGRSDWNTSTQPMNSNLPMNELTELNTEEPPVILTITFHPLSKTSGNNQENTEAKSIAPRKQIIHILSNQRLSDLRDVVVCSADKIPICNDLNGTPSWCDNRWVAGAVFLIEDVLFPDTRNLSDSVIVPQSAKSDYGLLLQELLPDLIEKDKVENLCTKEEDSDSISSSSLDDGNHDNDDKTEPEKRKKIQLSSLSMEQVKFDQLTLRINEPYWMLHQGNCEHIFTIDEIRAMHPTDPSPNSHTSTSMKKLTGASEIHKNKKSQDKYHAIKTNPYPITSFLSRLNSPKCRVCDRDPAQLVTISDELCSESPCFICFTCFKLLHSHEGNIFENPRPTLTPNSNAQDNNNHHHHHHNFDQFDLKNIRWGQVQGRDWWAVPLLDSS